MKIKIIKNKKQLNEEFYFQQGFDQNQRPPANPLSLKLVKTIASKLPGTKEEDYNKMKQLKASGAEGIVISLDDKRVIKLFHDVSNAAKNLHLVSANIPETAQVYSMGKIILNHPVVYYKFGSSHNKRTLANPTKELYFIVMQRVIPDNFIYLYVDQEWDKINRISRLDAEKLKFMYSSGIPSIQQTIERIYLEIVKDPQKYNLNNAIVNKRQRGGLQTFADLIQSKKDLGRFAQSFTKYRKGKSKSFLIYTNINAQGRGGFPVGLKNLILNYLGEKNDLADAKKIFNHFKSLPQMQKKAKAHPLKKNKGATLADDLQEITDLIKAIRVDKGLAWNDIHQEQFGRNQNGDLIGLDLGIKGTAKELAAAPGKFEAANVIRVATNFDWLLDQPTMTLAESKKKKYKTLNVFDFDRTLFWTIEKEEGSKKWEQIYGKPYPHKGWFGKPESLDLKLNTPINKTMKKIYNTLRSDPDGLCILNSNRYVGLEKTIKSFLRHHGFRMDAVLLKTGKDNKGKNLQDFWNDYPEITVINCFDDKDASLNHYKKLKDRYSIYREDLTFNIYKVTKNGITKV